VGELMCHYFKNNNALRIIENRVLKGIYETRMDEL
jgi:hypothetical protein